MDDESIEITLELLLEARARASASRKRKMAGKYKRAFNQLRSVQADLREEGESRDGPFS